MRWRCRSAPGSTWPLARSRDLLDQQNVSAEHADVVQRLSKVLNGWHQMALAAKLKPESEATKGMSAEQLRKLRSLGYIR